MKAFPIYPVVLFKVLKSSRNTDKSTEIGHLSEILSNPSISQDLLSPYSRNQEGHFQGIFATGYHLLQNLFLIRAHLYPLEIQFSIGIGEVKTPINSVMATHIEGKSIENANFGLFKAPKSGHYLIMHGFSKKIERLMNPSMGLLWATTRNWNHNRLKILNYKLGGYSEAQISQLLAISERAIYKNIAEARLGNWKDLILAVEENISRVLKTYQ